MMKLHQFMLVVAVVAMGARPCVAAEPITKLASGGSALMPVVVGENAGQRTRDAAKTLAGQFVRISGAAFEVRAGDGSSGCQQSSFKWVCDAMKERSFVGIGGGALQRESLPALVTCFATTRGESACERRRTIWTNGMSGWSAMLRT